jgi:hypothetical protein
MKKKLPQPGELWRFKNIGSCLSNCYVLIIENKPIMGCVRVLFLGTGNEEQDKRIKKIYDRTGLFSTNKLKFVQ